MMQKSRKEDVLHYAHLNVGRLNTLSINKCAKAYATARGNKKQYSGKSTIEINLLLKIGLQVWMNLSFLLEMP
jgi:hypothetical protein